MGHRILVTGSEGFVGRALCDYLSSKGHNVLGSDIQVPVDDPERTCCNITDRRQIDNLLEWAGEITHVIHLAAITFVPQADQGPAHVMDVNLDGTIKLADAIYEIAPNARLIFVGSAEAYGKPETLPLTENHPLNPANPYAISKAAADQYAKYLFDSRGAEIIRMRPFNHSGPGQSDNFVLSSFAHQITKIEKGIVPPVINVGNLSAARDFLHVNDVIRAYECAIDKAVAGEAYNVCSGTSHTIQDALDTLLDMSTAEIEVHIDRERLRPVDVPETRGSYAKFTEAVGWQPEIPFEKILSDLLEYWRNEES